MRLIIVFLFDLMILRLDNIGYFDRGVIGSEVLNYASCLLNVFLGKVKKVLVIFYSVYFIDKRRFFYVGRVEVR